MAVRVSWRGAEIVGLTLASCLCVAWFAGGAWVWVAVVLAGVFGFTLLSRSTSQSSSLKPSARLDDDGEDGESAGTIVHLRSVGTRRIYVMRVVRQFTGLSGEEARRVLGTLPRDFRLDSVASAEAMAVALRQEGADAGTR